MRHSARAVLLAVLAAGAISCGTGAGTPNVLVIVWDAVRADRLQIHGHDRPTTPRLAAFAAEGIVFEHAVSPGTWTLPAHASLFTGLPLSAHGATGERWWLDSRFETLAETFHAAGYDTYAFSANPLISVAANLAQGFDIVHYPWSKRWYDRARVLVEAKRIAGDRSTGGAGGDGADGRDVIPAGAFREAAPLIHEGAFKEAAPVVGEAFLTWLDQRPRGRPFFAFLNYMEAHAPRTPSLRARRRVMPEEMVERSLIVDQRNGTLLAYTFGRHRYTDEEIAVIQGVYDASLVELDEATGDLLDALADRGLLDDTIVVLTSDHGEHLGDHRLFGHRFSLYDALVRVPLVVRYPARLPPGRVERTVSLLDLRPTLLDLAGVRGAATEESSRSLFAPVAAESVPVFSELDQVAPGFVENAARRYPDLDWTPWLRTYRAAVADGFKLIRASDGQRQLFETAVDPAETRDVAAARPQVAARLEAAIDGWLASFDHYDRASATDEPPPLAPALGEKLKALGYIDDEG